MNTKKLTYLACPYSHTDPVVMEARFNAANKAAAKLMSQGDYVYSPISHTHPIALAGKLPLGWDFWEAYDRAILEACGKMVVLTIPGWKESKGVAAEMEIAYQAGMPILLMDPVL